MRVYERKIEFDFDYPEDMEMILDYLNKHGEILTSELTIEEFEDWLEHYDRPSYRY